MADYWKSQAKKFCDFCKCWIADNKPSVEFHEKGKRHKENVEKRLKEISAKSRKEFKEAVKVDEEMKKMEEAAMQAYLQDIQGDGQGDYTAQVIKQEIKEREDAAREEKRRKEIESVASRIKEEKVEDECCQKQEPCEASSSKVKVKKEAEEEKMVWQEAKSDEGHLYYWNVNTGEAVWEPPLDGFLSIQQQKAKEEEENQRQKGKEEEENQRKKEVERQKNEQEKAEEDARKAREKMKSRSVKEPKKKAEPFEPVFSGPAPKPEPYGAWKTVERVVTAPVDYQLPVVNYQEVSVPILVEKEQKFRFREKTVTVLEAEGSGDFKKRKLNHSAKRNARQRTDDD